VKTKIQISSAIIRNNAQDLLVVRKHKSSYYMLPGGKIEANETLIDALLRELQEELGIQFTASDFTFLGTHETEAANEAGARVEGNIFLLNAYLDKEQLANYAEIEEVCWVSKTNYQNYQLAHLLQEFALPRWLADFK